MTFADFMEAFNMYNKKYNFKNLGMLIHFRIATHGAKDATMTHPFPIHSDDGALCKTNFISEYAIVHNGIISLTKDKATKSNLSDTAIFVKEYLSPLSNNRGWFNRPCNLELIERLLDGSKMALLNSKGDIINTRGFEEYKGVFYSNSSYKDTYYRYGKYYTNGTAYDTFDDNDYYQGGYIWSDILPTKSLPSGKDDSRNIGLMEVLVGETIEYDGCTKYVEPDEKGNFWVDKNGTVWITDNVKSSEDEDSTFKYNFYYLLGLKSVVYSVATTERIFKADIWCYSRQFPEM